MSPHEQVFELLPLYALDALVPDERDAVEAHVRGCVACQEELSAQEAVVASLAPDEPAPQHVWARIEVALDRE